MSLGLTFTVNFRLTKYYLWFGWSSELYPGEFTVYKYFSQTKWWEGALLENATNIRLKLHGSYVLITPIIVKNLSENDIENVNFYLINY
jgi:hypothetical protein